MEEAAARIAGSKLRPMGDRILVRQVEASSKTKGGLFIPDTAQEKPTEGIVLAIGKGRTLNDGTLLPIDLVIGDRVLFNKHAGCPVIIDGVEHIVLGEKDVVGVMEGAEG
jgi:chaperonin GroES